MVPPGEIDQAQPTTLPADFSEWDSGDAPATQPIKPATTRVTVLPGVERMPNAAARAAAAADAEAERVFQPPQPKGVRAGGAKQQDASKGNKGKQTGLLPLFAVGSLALLLILGAAGYFRLRPGTAMQKPSVAAQPTATITPQQTAANLPATTPAPEPATTGEDRQRLQSDMMNRQLNAPSRIPTDLKMLAGKEPAPTSGFTAAGLEGLGGGGSAGNVFTGQSGPKVKIAAPTKTTISAGVAGGLLIQKTTPVYPQIAREARVAGTVVIQATISKTGTIESAHVVNGPTMLRQPALDAVKSWRYKPYLLDGEPVEVDTTVSVTFTLGGG